MAYARLYRWVQPAQQHGLRIPLFSFERVFFIRILRVSAFLPEVTQQIHSLRASGVISSHTARARLPAGRPLASAFRKSSGKACTVPPASFFLVILLNATSFPGASFLSRLPFLMRRTCPDVARYRRFLPLVLRRCNGRPPLFYAAQNAFLHRSLSPYTKTCRRTRVYRPDTSDSKCDDEYDASDDGKRRKCLGKQLHRLDFLTF